MAWGLGVEGVGSAIGALIITYTILGVPHYTYSIMGPKTLIFIEFRMVIITHRLHGSSC